MSKLSDTKTLTELIEVGKNNPYLKINAGIISKIGDNKLILETFYDRYIDFIKNYATKVLLTEEEMQRYRYKPKKLSYDLYKTEELWFLLLKLNNMSSEIDFINKKRIYILEPSNIDILNRIIIVNNDEIENNHAQMSLE